MPAMSPAERSFCRSPLWDAFAERLVVPWVLDIARPRGDVLELGAGTGSMAAAMSRRFDGLRITATDVDPIMVKAASRRLSGVPGVSVQVADITALPYPDALFDAVACFLMLHHVVDWEIALGEVARVLKPGGSFLGYDLERTAVARLVHFLDRSPHQLVMASALREGLRTAGFEDVVVRSFFASHVMRFSARVPGLRGADAAAVSNRVGRRPDR